MRQFHGILHGFVSHVGDLFGVAMEESVRRAFDSL